MEIVSLKQYFFRGEAKISGKNVPKIFLSKWIKLQIETSYAFDVKAHSCFLYIF